jgi:hypothetical protein
MALAMKAFTGPTLEKALTLSFCWKNAPFSSRETTFKKNQEILNALKDKARDETEKDGAQALRDKVRQERKQVYATTERNAKRVRRADAQYATTEREAKTLAKSHRRAEKGKKNEVREKRSHRQG